MYISLDHAYMVLVARQQCPHIHVLHVYILLHFYNSATMLSLYQYIVM